MFPYWALFSLFAAGTLFSIGSPPKQRLSPLLRISLVVAAVMIGFRYVVGGDWDNYMGSYARFQSLDLWQALTMPNSDPGYGFINWVAQAFGARIWFVNFACASIFVWGLARLAVQQPSPWLFFLTAVPYGLIVVGMGYTRQSVAIGLCAAALASFRSQRTKGAVGFNIAAALFHKTCIFMFPLIALADRQKRLVNLILISLLIALVYYSLVSESKEELVDKYMGTAMASSGAGVRILMTLWPALVFLLFQRRFGFDELEIPLWRVQSYAALVSVTALALVPSSTVVDRLALYLIPFQSTILSRLPWAASKNGLEFPVTIMLAAYSFGVLFVWLNYALNAVWWLPYRFFPLF